MPKPHRECWAFSQSELSAPPTNFTSHDELLAYLDMDDGFEGIDGRAVIVYRNGETSNLFSDGTEAPEALQAIANMITHEASLLHPDGEETAVWKDVGVDDSGRFLFFA